MVLFCESSRIFATYFEKGYITIFKRIAVIESSSIASKLWGATGLIICIKFSEE